MTPVTAGLVPADVPRRRASDDVILRMRDVEARVGMNRRTIYRLIKDLGFPRPLTLSTARVGWRASDVDAWIASRVNATDAARR